MAELSLPEESIFAQAQEIGAAAERATFLDRACGDNPALRAEAEALLRANEHSGDLLDLPEQPAATVDEPTTERPGTSVGPYKLVEQIGRWLLSMTPRDRPPLALARRRGPVSPPHLRRAPVAVQPARGALADVPRGMSLSRGDEQLFADVWAVYPAGDLELHVALQHGDQLLLGVPEILPPLARRVGPDGTAEAAGGPVGGDPLAVGGRHRSSSSHALTPNRCPTVNVNAPVYSGEAG
jgi:hypothetical protein